MLALVVAVMLAVLIYGLCVALGLPATIGIVAAALVLAAGVRSAGWSEPGARTRLGRSPAVKPRGG
jgi:hypothetical protein